MLRLLAFIPVVVLLVILYILSFSINSLDFYYGKVVSGKKHSLIIGNSKPSQGIKPSTLNKSLSLNEGQEFYNYSFAAAYSPYGPVYYKSILSKIDTTTKNGIYIIAVDPGSISSNTPDSNDESAFQENNSFLANISTVDKRWNLEYIIFRQEVFYKKLFSNIIRGSGRLHNDGWLEVTVKTDSNTVSGRMKRNLKRFDTLKYNFSEKRMSYLRKLIIELGEYGKVYLIRMPIHPIFTKNQKEAIPDFENKMRELSLELNVPYKSYLNDNTRFRYTDGVHLTKESAEEFSLDLVKLIKEN